MQQDAGHRVAFPVGAVVVAVLVGAGAAVEVDRDRAGPAEVSGREAGDAPVEVVVAEGALGAVGSDEQVRAGAVARQRGRQDDGFSATQHLVETAQQRMARGVDGLDEDL